MMLYQHFQRKPAASAALVAAVALAGLAVAGCRPAASETTEKAGGDARPLVVATTTMIADLARQLGGDRIQVVALMPPGTDPHIYEPTPADSVVFRKAALVLYNGLHLEGRLLDIIENARARAVALAEDPRIKPRAAAGGNAAPDPHCWWDARHFMVYAERARDALIRVDPPGEAGYRARAEAYIRALADADAQVRAAIEQLPPARRYLITSHDAFYYYGAAYGLKVDAVLGISTDASVRALRADELAKLVVTERIPAIFHETSVSDALNRMVDRVVELARKQGHEVRVAHEPLYSDSLGAPDSPAGTYIGALLENTRIIVSALRAAPASQSSERGEP